MISPDDGVLTFEQPSLRIDPSLTRSTFLRAAWAQGAADLGSSEPQHSWRLCGQYWSLSLPFNVILCFDGERLRMLEFCLPDPNSGLSSWADYSDEKAQKREDSQHAWLSKCLGEQRSFAWGTVRVNHDPHGGGSDSIMVEYAASSPGVTLPSQSGVRPREDGSRPVKDGSATKTSTSPSPAVVSSPDVPNVEKNVWPNFPPPPRKIRRR